MANLEIANSSDRNNSVKPKVYCDNEELKKYILDAKPSKNGLYPHELTMIFYASIGQFKTVDTDFAGLFKFQFKVENPNLMLESLIERGYIRTAKTDEVINYLKQADLRELMNLKELKCKGRASNDNMRIEISNNFSTEEIQNLIEFSFYIPTSKGKVELEQNEYITKNPYSGWNSNNGYSKQKYINPDDINVVNIDRSNLELHISRDKNTLKFISQQGLNENIISWTVNIAGGCKLSLYVDEDQVYEKAEVDHIYIAKNIKRIILCHSKSKGVIECVGYDYANKSFEYKEKIKEHFYSHAPTDQQEYFKMLDSFYEYRDETFEYDIDFNENLYKLKDEFLKGIEKLNNLIGIEEENYINYYVSVTNANPSVMEILLDGLKNKVDIKQLDNILSDDKSVNLKVKVNKEDNHTRNIIMFMIIDKLLQPPVIKEVGISKVMDFIRLKSSSRTHQILMDNFMEPYTREREVVEEVKKSISTDWKEVFMILSKIYPSRLFKQNAYVHYTSHNPETNDINWIEVMGNKRKWKKELSIIIKSLKT